MKESPSTEMTLKSELSECHYSLCEHFIHFFESTNGRIKTRSSKETTSSVILCGGWQDKGQEGIKNREADFSQILEMIVQQHELPPNSKRAAS